MELGLDVFFVDGLSVVEVEFACFAVLLHVKQTVNIKLLVWVHVNVISLTTTG